MPLRVVRKRARFFLAVEGESEQSFVAWLQGLSEKDHHIFLDAVVLGGGGFPSMLEKAVSFHERRSKTRGAYRDRFLMVDQDRVMHGDWSIEKLRREAAKHKMLLVVQRPNHEGLLLRLMGTKGRDIPEGSGALTQIRTQWPSYEKPVNAHTLARRFSLEDLLRVSAVDADLGMLLKHLGFAK